MKTYNLPRGYLSYSAYSLWKSSKDQYRKRYYLNEPSFQSAETVFGKKVHEKFEKDDYVVGSETMIEVDLTPELKLLGYIDSFNIDNLSFVDYKTGHLSKAGKVPWDNLKVRKHKQLVFYSLLIRIKYGSYNKKAQLHWIETEFTKETREFDGHILEATSRKLGLTGREEVFNREIAEWELDLLKEDIISVAEAISEDYTLWQNQN